MQSQTAFIYGEKTVRLFFIPVTPDKGGVWIVFHYSMSTSKDLKLSSWKKGLKTTQFPSFFKNQVFLSDKVIGKCVRMIVVLCHS